MRQVVAAGNLIEYICIDVLGFWAQLIRLDPRRVHWFVLQTIDWAIEMAALPFLILLRGFTIIYYKEEFSESWLELIVTLVSSYWLLFWERGLRPVRAAVRFFGRCIECVIIACLDVLEKPAAQRLWQWTLSPLATLVISGVTWVSHLVQKLVLHVVSVMTSVSWQVVKKCVPSGKSNWEREDREVLLKGKSQKGKTKQKAKKTAPVRSAHSTKLPLNKATNKPAPSHAPQTSSLVKGKEQVSDSASSGLFSVLQQAAVSQTERKAPTTPPSGSQQPIPTPVSHLKASDAPTVVADNQTQQMAAAREQEGCQEAARKRQKQKQKKNKGVKQATAAGTDSTHTVAAAPSLGRVMNSDVPARETHSPTAADAGSKILTSVSEAPRSTVADGEGAGESSGAVFRSEAHQQQHMIGREPSGTVVAAAPAAVGSAEAPMPNFASGAQLLWLLA